MPARAYPAPGHRPTRARVSTRAHSGAAPESPPGYPREIRSTRFVLRTPSERTNTGIVADIPAIGSQKPAIPNDNLFALAPRLLGHKPYAIGQRRRPGAIRG